MLPTFMDNFLTLESAVSATADLDHTVRIGRQYCMNPPLSRTA